jgi:hypothetical protein
MPVYGLHQVDLAPMLIHMDVMVAPVRPAPATLVHPCTSYADNAGAVIGLRGSLLAVPTEDRGNQSKSYWILLSG